MSDDDDNVVPFRPPDASPRFIERESGGSPDEFGVTLAIYGEELDPDEVSAILLVRPTRCHRRGHRMRLTAPPRPTGAWFLERRGMAPVQPNHLLAELAAALPLDDDHVWTTLRARFRIELRWGIHMTGWNRGFALDGALVSRFSNIVHEIGFDIYAYPEEDESEP